MSLNSWGAVLSGLRMHRKTVLGLNFFMCKLRILVYIGNLAGLSVSLYVPVSKKVANYVHW